MATTHYDADSGDDVTGDGSVGTPYKTMTKFTSVDVRSAGDIGIFRNNRTATYQHGTPADLAFDEDGTIVNPIIMKRDYANAFSDDVDLSVTATATPVFGSKVIVFSADVSGVLAAGDWIYAASDDAEFFSYEVDTVSTVTVTLFLPYKGAQAGAGKTMTNIGSPPIWGDATAAFAAVMSGDLDWQFQGIHFRGTSASGVFSIANLGGELWRDCIFEANGAADNCFEITANSGSLLWQKCRFFNYYTAIGVGGGAIVPSQGSEVYDSLLDGNSASLSGGVRLFNNPGLTFIECELKNHADGDFVLSGSSSTWTAQNARGRNCLFSSTTKFDVSNTARLSFLGMEDYQGVIGDTRQFTHQSIAEDTPILQSETTLVRSGGAATSIKVTPSSDLSPAWEHSRAKLFEIPYYVDTTSRQYDVYFRPTLTTDWTTDPVAAELWIEAEYWNHATNNFRTILKSTGVIDMNGSTAWAALSVTAAPAQAGILYLRCYYAKTPDDTDTFVCDPEPVVT